MALNYSIDGNQVCAVGVHFRDLQQDHAGFGDSLKDAFLDYYNASRKLPTHFFRDCREWERAWVVEAELQLNK